MADGGIVETPEQLRKRIAEKYGVDIGDAPPAAGPSTPVQKPQPTEPKPEKSGNPLVGIKNLFSGRGAQIDKASGYAKGGIVKGKGTPTSDDVPMTVNGKNVNLSNLEAVLPHATVMALGGPEAVERLIAATNGKPPVKGGLREGGEYGDGTVDELLKSVNMNYGNVQNGTPPNPLAVPSLPVTVGAGQAPTIYDNGGIQTPTAQVPARAPSRIYDGIPDSVGKPPADSPNWSLGAGTAPTIYDNGGLPTTTDRVPAKAPDAPAAPAPSSSWSIGAGSAPTIYDNGGLPAATVQSGIDTMRGQLNNPMVTAAAPSAPSAQPSASAQPATRASSFLNLPPVFNDAEKVGPSAKPVGVDGFVNGVVNMFKDSATAARTGVHYDEVKAQREAADRATKAAQETQSPASSPYIKTPSFGPNPMQNVGASVPTDAYKFSTGSKPGEAPTAPAFVNGRNADGVITAESAMDAYGKDMKRSGGIFGTMDLNAVNAIDERANKARGDLINSMIAAQGGNGIAVLPDAGQAELPGGMTVAEWNKRVGADDAMKGMGSRTKATYMAAMANNDTHRRGQDMIASEAAARDKTTLRGQDLTAQAEANRLAGNPLDAALKRAQLTGANMTNETASQLLTLRDAYTKETDPAKRAQLAEQYRVISGKSASDRFISVPGGEEIGPDGYTKIRRPNSVFDSSTRTFVQAPNQDAAAPSFASKADLQAAIKAGKVKPGQVVTTPNGPMVVK